MNKFQAWQGVKVISEESGFTGQAGSVIRTETHGDIRKVFVKMDADESIQGFDEAELTLLG